MQSTHRRINIGRLTPVGAQAFAARNLELLAAIENTIDISTHSFIYFIQYKQN